MSVKIFLTIFATVFLAELGDKTQLATLLYAADAKNSKWMVFTAAVLALIFSSAAGVWAGSLLSKFVSPGQLSRSVGLGFIAIGLWTLTRA